MMELVEVADLNGFVKIDRNLRKWRWFKNPKTLAVWMWLLLSANFEPRDFEQETIHRGEVVTSRKTLSQETGLTENEVRTALTHLKTTGEITIRTRPKYSVISILGYDKYQATTTSKSTNRSPADHQQTTSKSPQRKNAKNQRTEERKDVCVTTHTPTASEVEAFFRDRWRSSADAAKFYAYNSGRGWKVGRTPIADWKSVAEMWIAQGDDNAAEPQPELDAFGKPIKKEFW